MTGCSYTVDTTGVALMTIDRPPVNALSSSLIDAIQENVDMVLSDKRVHAVVLTGKGKGFIAGAELKELAAINSRQEAAVYIEKAHLLMNRIAGSDKPFIALIHGFALGGGLELALACHIRIAEENAKIGFPETSLGIIPGFGGSQRAPRLIGEARALEMILGGVPISGTLAESYGLVNYSVPEGEGLGYALMLAVSIAQKGRDVVIAAMKAIREGMKMDIASGFALEAELFYSLVDSGTTKEGIASFLEKRNKSHKES